MTETMAYLIQQTKNYIGKPEHSEHAPSVANTLFELYGEKVDPEDIIASSDEKCVTYEPPYNEDDKVLKATGNNVKDLIPQDAICIVSDGQVNSNPSVYINIDYDENTGDLMFDEYELYTDEYQHEDELLRRQYTINTSDEIFKNTLQTLITNGITNIILGNPKQEIPDKAKFLNTEVEPYISTIKDERIGLHDTFRVNQMYAKTNEFEDIVNATKEIEKEKHIRTKTLEQHLGKDLPVGQLDMFANDYGIIGDKMVEYLQESPDLYKTQDGRVLLSFKDKAIELSYNESKGDIIEGKAYYKGHKIDTEFQYNISDISLNDNLNKQIDDFIKNVETIQTQIENHKHEREQGHHIPNNWADPSMGYRE